MFIYIYHIISFRTESPHVHALTEGQFNLLLKFSYLSPSLYPVINVFCSYLLY